ncbi:RNA polymerase sigma factor [Pseudonocardia sp. GCM10023141]|uniref:RNA polymerase sigma factor n=1 Tax=Pseudonocardia sp. GCM10023141 TaxID=3252653 RepID=UPI00360BB48C
MPKTSSLPRRTAPCTGPCARLCTEAGFAAAYQEHRPRMIAKAMSMLGDPGLAEDAVQDAFLRAWSACPTFDPGNGPPLVSWLLTITRNIVIDGVRARASRPQTAPADSSPEPADRRAAVDAIVLRSVLVDALATVSPEHRAIVVQTVVRDRSHADVAAELGVPVGTVKSRVFYALRGMRGVIDQPEALSA